MLRDRLYTNLPAPLSTVRWVDERERIGVSTALMGTKDYRCNSWPLFTSPSISVGVSINAHRELTVVRL